MLLKQTFFLITFYPSFPAPQLALVPVYLLEERMPPEPHRLTCPADLVSLPKPLWIPFGMK